LLSMWIWDIDPMFPPEIYARNWSNWRRMSLEGDDSWKRFESIHRTKSGEIRQVEVSTEFAVFQGKVYLITTDRDITERRATEEQIKATLREKEVMLKEIHHRVKNNLQIISSLLSIQSQYLADSRDLELFRRSQDRVRSMALVHEQLYQTDDLAAIDFAPYVESLVRNLVASYRGDAGNVRLKLDVAGVFLGIDTAIPCGLIINELASNALKHAFPGDRAGQLTVYMRHEDGSYVLEVGDDGTGLSHPQDIRKSQSMGLQLVTLLTEQLDGTISIDASCGTRFRITFNGPLVMKSAGGGKENEVPGGDD
jgi:two-component system, sensor histidine kinase PdtaS